MRKFIRILGIFLILISLSMFGYIYFRDNKIASDIERGKHTELVNVKDHLTDDELKNKETEGNDPIETIIDDDNRGLVIGKIAIPSVGINLPIYKGEFSELGDNMLFGAVTNKQNQEMGKRNYVLSSHIVNNPEYLFTSLSKVSVGDYIYLADTDYLYTYKITDGKVVKPSEVWILDDIPNKATITLYTCKYINEYENGVQKTDRTVRFGDFVAKEKLTKDLEDKYFGF